MPWSPDQYEKFAFERLRPALDLMQRIPDVLPQNITDLGCGTGSVTCRLAGRWPDASVEGIDTSEAMIARAKRRNPSIAWMHTDFSTWQASQPTELVFSNNALQWIGNHSTLFPNLMAQVAHGGVLAVQMSRNYAAPSHSLIRDIAASGPWAQILAQTSVSHIPVHAPEDYYGWLKPLCRCVEIWQTEYLHVLDGDNAVFEWTKGTFLNAAMDALAHDPVMLEDFLGNYREALAQAYPQQPDGSTLLGYNRLFIIAHAK